MAGLVTRAEFKTLFCGLKLLLVGEDSEQVVDIPAPLPTVTHDQQQKEKSDNNSNGGVVTSSAVSCAAVSPAGDKIAVCDDRKQVCVFRVTDLRQATHSYYH